MELAEMKAQEQLYKVVRLTNKTDFDFTSEMGARYGGVPYLVPAGKSLLLPKPVAELLAKHLARQSFIKKAPIRDEKETDGKGTDRPLWTEQQVQERARLFLSDEFEQERPEVMSEAAIMAQRVKELNENFGQSAKSPKEEAPKTVDESKSPTVYQDKREVIAELEKRGIKHDKRKSKADLEALLV